ncbi:DUF1385 domain-containing protein [Bacillus sp. BGMRC 2118]|nr:DUF1385 domain-containing protein [Bacillus sp. BGMRC 2118]
MTINEVLINGGMAHSNAVSFYGKNYESRATRKKNGEIEVELKKLKPLPNWLHNMLRVPLLRGFADTLYAFYMKWYVGLFFMLLPLIMNYRMEMLADMVRSSGPDRFGFLSGLLSGFLVVVIMLKVTPMGKYHAAEHVMHNLYLQNSPITVEEGKNTSRIHEWCGTSVFILLAIYTVIMSFIPGPLWLKVVLWFPFYGEVLFSENSIVRTIFMPFKMVGYAFQLLTTSKPKEEHLEVSRQAFQVLLDKEQSLEKMNKTA